MTFRRILRSARSRFSALQRAENSSMACVSAVVTNPTPFQCSSASRKFLNKTKPRTLKAARWCFSALQRAENSSIATAIAGAGGVHRRFQCSSASRKFLNWTVLFGKRLIVTCFSALQRAENSSICVSARLGDDSCRFQCSSASRKFLNRDRRSRAVEFGQVSVLFSEPKIPQW